MSTARFHKYLQCCDQRPTGDAKKVELVHGPDEHGVVCYRTVQGPQISCVKVKQ
jgi:hypothetical protein